MNDILSKLDAGLAKSVEHMEAEFGGLQVGRASSSLVENLMIESYGSMQPLKAVASVSIPDAKTLQIQPWDRGLLPAVEKAIMNSDLNLNPNNNGAAVILNIPPLTEERRRDLLKVMHRMAEEAKISVRNARHDAMNTLKQREHDKDITEDEKNRGEKQVQEKVDATNKLIDEKAKKKEDAIMTV